MISNTEPVVNKDIHQVNTRWNHKMNFISSVNGHDINLDKLAVHGGDDRGPRPKQLILSAAGGCIGMEIISITDKMRLKLDELEINVTAELTEGQPKMYKTVQVVIKLKCKDEDKEKIERAILLAVDKYCGVIAMLRHFAQVTSEIQFI